MKRETIVTNTPFGGLHFFLAKPLAFSVFAPILSATSASASTTTAVAASASAAATAAAASASASASATTTTAVAASASAAATANVAAAAYDIDQKIKKTCNKMFLEQPTVPISGELRYMAHLWVSGNEVPQEEPCQFDSSQLTTSGFDLQAENLFLYHQEVSYKIRAALKILTVREERVIVQFWSARVVGKDVLLTTIDQPFGLGVVSEELRYYRRDSESKSFLVDKDHEEQEALSPPARVFKRGLPEWTSDLTNYKTKDFPQQDCAIRCNLHGYLALPVFDPTTGLCVGVLELLTFSELQDVAYEVEHIHGVLKKGNLTSPQAFEVLDGPALNVSRERSKNELDKIYNILKHVCDTHWLPLALTWTMSPSTSYFAYEEGVEESCNSFNTRCLGKACMSTTLSYYVRDLNMWPFIDASEKRHLELSRGVAGRAMSSCGSCFCGDVTKLDEEEYPLVHNARMSRLTGCFAIFLDGVEGHYDYVLEFFLPPEIKDRKQVLNLVQTLEQTIEAASGFELGDRSAIEVIGPPPDLSVNTDSDSVVTDISETDTANSSIECIFTVEKSNFSIVDRKRKRDSDTVPSTSTVTVNATFNKSKEQFTFSLFHGLLKLKKKVAKRFKLEGQELQLKYIDEDKDLILVCCDEDLQPARDASGSNLSMNLICSKITL